MAQLFTAVALLIATFLWAPNTRAQDQPRYVMVIHGGAGTITRENMSEEAEQAYRAKLTEVLRAGYEVIRDGGTSLDAVETCIRIMEDSPLFNSGKGAVFTNEGTVELDASIMDGSTRNSGAVTGVKHIEHPITLARTVMTQSPHVMMAQEGAEAFAEEQGFEMVDNDFFKTERRRRQLEHAKQREREQSSMGEVLMIDPTGEAADYKFGTVGAVARDQAGNLAAGTSTGGMTNKRFGRIGDSPIIGAGTYADNETCAISATGHGEYFIRGVVAYDVAAMMRYAGLGLSEAANAVIHGRLTDLGGTGGIIAIDRDGHIATPFNTEGMYRGYVDEDGNITVEIYRN